MKVRLPKHREFLIKFAEVIERKRTSWQALNQIVADYSKDGKSVYTPTFIEDNEDKVKALQEQYEFTYEIIEKISMQKKKYMQYPPPIWTRCGAGICAKPLRNTCRIPCVRTLI